MNDSKPSKLANMQVFVSLGVPVLLIIAIFVGVEIYHAGPGCRKLNSHRYLGQCFKVTEPKGLEYQSNSYQSEVLNDALGVKNIDHYLWFRDSFGGVSPHMLLVGDLLKVDAVVKRDVIDPENHSKYIFMQRLAPSEHIDLFFVEMDACGKDGDYCLDHHPKMVPAPCPSAPNER